MFCQEQFPGDEARVGFLPKFKCDQDPNGKQVQTFVLEVRGRAGVKI